MNLHARKRGVELFQYLRNRRINDVVRNPEHHFAFIGLVGKPDDHLVIQSDHAPRVDKQLLAGCRQGNRAAGPVEQLEAEHIAELGKKIPDFQAGDTVRVGVKVTEGNRTRVQNYEGVCIARQGGSRIGASFTVRKISKLSDVTTKELFVLFPKGPAKLAAMVAGSCVGLSAYVLIAPYCAALFSAAVSAVVMAVGTGLRPEQFQWRILREG